MDWLNYHHLLYFWAVAKDGSLRQASKRLSVSQPSISAQIRLLEETCGTKLFQRQGRNLVLTETGHMVYGYAEEIFSLGQELTTVIKHRPVLRRLKLRVGIEDSFPKLMSYEILKPVFNIQPAMHVVCSEGKAEDLLIQLASHRLDMVLADQPATAGAKIKVFSHLLGESGVTFCACRSLARKLRRNFPQSLNGAPALLPTQNTTLRRSLEEWFHSLSITPQVLAEFEDSAVMKIVAADGLGFIPVPSAAFADSRSRFELEAFGSTDQCRDRFYLITAERRLAHPGVMLITERARRLSSSLRHHP